MGDSGSRKKISGGFQSIDVEDVSWEFTEKYFIKIYRQIFIHPKYDFPHNDIALIRLRSPATTSGWVYPICLPNGETPFNKTTCWLNGLEMKS